MINNQSIPKIISNSLLIYVSIYHWTPNTY